MLEESAKIIFNDISTSNLNRSSNFQGNTSHGYKKILIVQCHFKCHIWLETFSDFPGLVIFLFFYTIALLCQHMYVV